MRAPQSWGWKRQATVDMRRSRPPRRQDRQPDVTGHLIGDASSRVPNRSYSERVKGQRAEGKGQREVRRQEERGYCTKRLGSRSKRMPSVPLTSGPLTSLCPLPFALCPFCALCPLPSALYSVRVSVPRFDSLGLADPIVKAVMALGYEEPTPIQHEAIPVLLAGKDLIGQAGTGTGKTAAFALPMLHRLLDSGGKGAHGPRGLILVPTRELAMQVAEAVHKYAKANRPSRRAGLRRRAHGSADPRASPRRRRHRRDARTRARFDAPEGARAGRHRGPRPRRSRRNARHGICRGPRDNPYGHAGDPPDGAFCGDDGASDCGDCRAST